MNTIALIPGMQGGPEVLLVLFVILLLFGAKKLPELSRSLGKSLGEFKKGKEDLEREIREAKEDVVEPKAKPEPEPAVDVVEVPEEDEDEVKAPASDD
jgi:sec-independent protein translocase protein TatA